MNNIYKWNDCNIPIFKQYKEIFQEQYDTLHIYSVQEGEKHYDTVSLFGNILNYDSNMRNKYELTDEECYACIAHEIGHLKDTFSHKTNGENDEEEHMRSYIREFHADEQASKQELEDELMSALKKMCPKDNFLTLLRIKRLQELKKKRLSDKHNTKVTSIPVMIFALLLRDNGYTEWDRKNHPKADIIVSNKDNEKEKFYFEIKETSKNEKVFGAATLTEWDTAYENKGHYFFVIIKDGTEGNALPQYVIYSPQEFITYSTVPPFKFNFNIDKLNDKDSAKTNKEKLDIIKSQKDVSMSPKRSIRKSRNSVKLDEKLLRDLRNLYYGTLKKDKYKRSLRFSANPKK